MCFFYGFLGFILSQISLAPRVFRNWVKIGPTMCLMLHFDALYKEEVEGRPPAALGGTGLVPRFFY